MITRVRNYFLQGLLILIPLCLTGLLFWKLYEILNDLILIHIHYLLSKVGINVVPALDILILILFITVIGFVGGHFLGQKILKLTDYFLNKIPMVRTIYGLLQQFVETLFQKKGQKQSKVALIEYPRKGIYSIGFVTSETKGEVQENLSSPCWSIFIPTTPNPTSGFLIFVPKEQVKLLDIPMELAAKLVMSAGVITEEGKP